MSIRSANTSRRRATMRIAFLAAIAIKGLDGLVETLAGFAVAILGTHGIYDLAIQFTAPELDLHPASKTLHVLQHGASSLAHASSRFLVIWLVAHGIIKLALAVELLRGKVWIFPVAAAILSGFVAYMTYRLLGHYSPWLLAFALFDLVTVVLVLNEWRSHRPRPGHAA